MTTEMTRSPKRELKDWLQGESFKRELAALLPKTMKPERFVRIAFQAIHRNPELLKCSQESFFNCLLSLGAMGLEPDGRRAHLIPFGAECTLIVDYKGIAELLRRNHDVSAMHCDVVGANDKFECRFGSRAILDHVPHLRDRGAIICAYSWVKLPDGNEEFDVMGFEEIETIRKRSKTPNKGPWVTDWNEMAKKTVFRRHSKTLPLSPETRDALERETDGDALTEGERFAAAAPVKAAVVAGEEPRRRGRPPKLAQDLDETVPGVIEPPSAEEEVGQTKSSTITPPAMPASLAQQVATRLRIAGYSEEELIAVLKTVKLAAPEVTKLAECRAHALEMVLTEWENAERRMREARPKMVNTQNPELNLP